MSIQVLAVLLAKFLLVGPLLLPPALLTAYSLCY